jgi:hypothetical protein
MPRDTKLRIAKTSYFMDGVRHAGHISDGYLWTVNLPTISLTETKIPQLDCEAIVA